MVEGLKAQISQVQALLQLAISDSKKMNQVLLNKNLERCFTSASQVRDTVQTSFNHLEELVSKLEH